MGGCTLCKPAGPRLQTHGNRGIQRYQEEAFRSPKPVTKHLALTSRAHAEIVHTLAVHGFHGPVRLPGQEKPTQLLRTTLAERLSSISAKALELAHSRTTDDKKITDLANLLERWMLHGKPTRQHAPQAKAP